jgi:RNA polymerase sigma factor (TIGR02999 family)
MSDSQDSAISALLSRIRSGDSHATAELLDIAYNQLRGIAGNLFADQQAEHTLQPTALVNEVCLRLLKSPKHEWNDQQHFYRVAARAMRQLLVDHARARGTQKRGAGNVRVALEMSNVPAQFLEVDLVALDDTLAKLAAMDSRLSQIFELRFLVGLSVERTASVLDVSARTVELDTRLIRAWMLRELYG